MKTMKHFSIILMAAFMLLSANVAFGANDPEAYMGFSVSEEWYVFSKNMDNQELLDAVGMTAEEVNRTLEEANCAYILKNPSRGRDIQVRIVQNDLTYELYNISDTEDDIIRGDINRILKDGFAIDSFSYDSNNIQLTTHLQTKFIIIPGSVQFDGSNHGMVVGVTFVNGKGIAFTMYLEDGFVSQTDIEAFYEVINSTDFTVIKEKGSEPAPTAQKDESVDALAYISGGLGGLALVALCYYMIGKIRTTGRNEKHGNKK